MAESERSVLCRGCGASIDVSNPFATSVPCPRCGKIRKRGAQAPAPLLGVPTAAEAGVERGEVALPAKFRVETGRQGVKISWSWFSAAAIFGLVFCAIWDTVTFPLGFALVSGPTAKPQVVLFALIFPAVGAWITYTTLGQLLNHTTVTIRGGRLSIANGPLPWPGNRALGRESIEQIYTKEVERHDKNRGRYHLYELWAELREGKRVKLLGRLDTPEQALYLEQMIEDLLEIDDRAVPGELPRAGSHSS